jgi:hypothetical protein
MISFPMNRIKPRLTTIFIPGVLLLGEFSKSQPNQAMQTALNNLMLCGETAGLLSRESSFVTEPMMSGKAVDEMIRQCRGLCID